MKLRHRSPLAARRLPGQIVQTGEVRKTSPQARRSFDYYAIVLLIAGRGWFRDAKHETVNISAGDVFLLFPGVWHSYGPRPGDDWHETYIVFNGPVFDLWRASGCLDADHPVIHTASPVVWRRRMESVPVARELRAAGHALRETCRLQQLLADLLGAHQDGAPPARPGDRDWIASVKTLLARKDEADPDDRRFAARLGMTPDAFRKRFRRACGKPFRHYLNERRTAEACRLLVETRLTHRQICERLGYCDEFYFCRAFKKATGQTPREYRQTLKW